MMLGEGSLAKYLLVRINNMPRSFKKRGDETGPESSEVGGRAKRREESTKGGTNARCLAVA